MATGAPGKCCWRGGRGRGTTRSFRRRISLGRRFVIHEGHDITMTPDPNWYGLVFILLVGIAWVLFFGRYADDDTTE